MDVAHYISISGFGSGFNHTVHQNFHATHITQISQNKWTKISDLKTNIFELKMMVKSGLEFFILKFYQPLQRYLLTCQANSAFLGRFFALGSSNSEGHRGISKYFFLDHFSSSFLSQKWCQISVRIFCVLSGTRNLQW